MEMAVSCRADMHHSMDHSVVKTVPSHLPTPTVLMHTASQQAYSKPVNQQCAE